MLLCKPIGKYEIRKGVTKQRTMNEIDQKKQNKSSKP